MFFWDEPGSLLLSQTCFLPDSSHIPSLPLHLTSNRVENGYAVPNRRAQTTHILDSINLHTNGTRTERAIPVTALIAMPAFSTSYHTNNLSLSLTVFDTI
ncbi:hypothetical protein CW304_23800 [Bacillus sp. UFRGS-B20]|nr:hypothetical protein CW304_23800 [Bacillus sp. UFRGS-B20]